MAASTIGQHVTIEELRERYVLKEVDGETWVVWKTRTGGRGKIGKRAGGKSGVPDPAHTTGYRRIGFVDQDGRERKIREHNVVFALHYGRWPDHTIDHIDGNGLNNNPSNLREATTSQNRFNIGVYKNNKLGVKGICVRHGTRADVFVAEVAFGGTLRTRKRVCKSFPTLEEAVAWRTEMAQKHHGEFARV